MVDAKRGDVGSTNDAYAEAYLGAGAPLAADALTVHPYLGMGAMGSFVSRAHEAGSCVLVVTRSSNPEGRLVQSALDPSGHTVEEGLLLAIGGLNATLAPGEIGPVGAVIGPTHIDPPLDLVAPQGLFLAPGVGRAGRHSRPCGTGLRHVSRRASCPAPRGHCSATVLTSAGSATPQRDSPKSSVACSACRNRLRQSAGTGQARPASSSQGTRLLRRSRAWSFLCSNALARSSAAQSSSSLRSTRTVRTCGTAAVPRVDRVWCR